MILFGKKAVCAPIWARGAPLAACIVILLFVFYEKSFDNFHHNNLYRLNEVQKFPGMVASQKVGLSMFPMGPTIQAEFPEIRKFTRIR